MPTKPILLHTFVGCGGKWAFKVKPKLQDQRALNRCVLLLFLFAHKLPKKVKIVSFARNVFSSSQQRKIAIIMTVFSQSTITVSAEKIKNPCSSRFASIFTKANYEWKFSRSFCFVIYRFHNSITFFSNFFFATAAQQCARYFHFQNRNVVQRRKHIVAVDCSRKKKAEPRQKCG